MLFQLKEKKNKFNYSRRARKFEKFKIIISKVKYVAKNVIYLKKWSKKSDDFFEKNKVLTNFHKSKNFEFKFANFTVKIINEPDPLLLKAKELRYKSFFGKSGKNFYDSDKFDEDCDHLVVIDNNISKDYVVGTYRLLHKPKSSKYRLFYSESEFNLSNFFNLGNISMLEAGRSCVHEDYRDGRIIKLLWRGLASYIIENKIDLIFGCASFPSSNHKLFANQLSYLHHYHLPPIRYSTKPLDHIKANYEIVDRSLFEKEDQFRALPPLIKAYIRTGAWIGQGAIIDKEFNTTDVLIILKSQNIIKKYSKLSFRAKN